MTFVGRNSTDLFRPTSLSLCVLRDSVVENLLEYFGRLKFHTVQLHTNRKPSLWNRKTP